MPPDDDDDRSPAAAGTGGESTSIKSGKVERETLLLTEQWLLLSFACVEERGSGGSTPCHFHWTFVTLRPLGGQVGFWNIETAYQFRI
jgi:hypothetical protein